MTGDTGTWPRGRQRRTDRDTAGTPRGWGTRGGGGGGEVEGVGSLWGHVWHVGTGGVATKGTLVARGDMGGGHQGDTQKGWGPWDTVGLGTQRMATEGTHVAQSEDAAGVGT